MTRNAVNAMVATNAHGKRVVGVDFDRGRLGAVAAVILKSYHSVQIAQWPVGTVSRLLLFLEDVI